MIQGIIDLLNHDFAPIPKTFFILNILSGKGMCNQQSCIINLLMISGLEYGKLQNGLRVFESALFMTQLTRFFLT